MNRFGIIGINYTHVQNLSEFSNISISPSEKAEINFKLKKYLHGVLWLNTCNRHEVFYQVKDIKHHTIIQELLSNFLFSKNFNPGFYKVGRSSFNYLLELSLGMHSLIYGETEIIKQLREAIYAPKYNLEDFVDSNSGLENAEENAEFILENIEIRSEKFNQTLQYFLMCSKKIRRENNFIPKPLSLNSLAIRKLNSYLNFTKKPQIALYGNGKLGVELAKALVRTDLYWVVRDKVKVAALNIPATIVTQAELEELIDKEIKLDGIITATSAPSPIINKAISEKMFLKKINYGNKVEFLDKKPSIIIDLGIPANVSDDVKEQINTITYEQISREVKSNIENRINSLDNLQPDINKELNSIQVKIISMDSRKKIKEIQEKVYLESRKKLEDLLHHKLPNLSQKEKSAVYKWAIDFNKSLNRIHSHGLEEILDGLNNSNDKG